jgi:hypothetical protein
MLGAEGLDWFVGMGQEGADDFRALLTGDRPAADRSEQRRAEAFAATASSIAGTTEDFGAGCGRGPSSLATPAGRRPGWLWCLDQAGRLLYLTRFTPRRRPARR